MGVKTALFTNQGRAFQCIKVSVKNLNSVAKWSGGTAMYKVDNEGVESNHRIRLRTPNGIRVAKVGDYVVRDAETRFFAIKKADFEADFVPSAA